MNSKITSLIEAMYDNVECAVVTNSQLTEWFRAEIGARQCCLLSLNQVVPELMQEIQAIYQPLL